MKQVCFFVFLLLLFLEDLPAAKTQFLQKLKVHALAEKIEAKSIKIVLQGVIQSGWHIYTTKKNPDFPLQTKIEFLQEGWDSIKLQESTPLQIYDELAKNSIAVHKDVFELVQVARWQKNQALPREVYFALWFQICNQKICSLPQKLTFQTAIL